MDLKTANSQNFKKIILWIILLCGFLLRLLALFISDNFHGIAAGKIFSANYLIENPNAFDAWIVPAHGPVHFYILALALKLFGQPLFVPRVISLIFGTAFLIIYFKFIRQIFNESVAIISLIIVAFFPLHIVHSVLSTAAVTFLFFLFLGLLCYAKFEQTSEKKYVIFSALLIGCASLCRFEGGVFIIILSLFLLKKPKQALLFFSISMILPGIWMICNYLYGGNLLFFLCASDSIVHTEFAYLRSLGNQITFFKKMLYWPFQIKNYFGWPIVVCGIIGAIFFGWQERKSRKLLLLALAMLCIFSYKTIQEELAMQPRYGMSLGVLFVPFFSVALTKILSRLPKNTKATVLGIFLLYVVFRSSYLMLLQLPHTPEWIKQTSLFLKQNIKAEEMVFIDADEDNEKEPIKIYSGLGVHNFVDYNPFFSHVELMDPGRRRQLKYIVLVGKRELSNLKEVFRVDKCKIYRVKKIDEKKD